MSADEEAKVATIFESRLLFLTTGPNLPYIDADDFALRFSLRAQNLMWLLDAGAPASAGVPTAMDML